MSVKAWICCCHQIPQYYNNYVDHDVDDDHNVDDDHDVDEYDHHDHHDDEDHTSW